MRCTTAVAAALFVVASVAAPSSAQRRPRAPSIARAWAVFAEVEHAARDLAAVHVEPADANGELRGWDRRWERRLIDLDRSMEGACALVDDSCAARLVDALACHTAHMVLSSRALALTSTTGSTTPLSEVLAGDRAIAAEAARRIQRHLVCEDLPRSYDLDCAGGTCVTIDGHLLDGTVAPEADR